MTVALSASTINSKVNLLPLSGRLAVETAGAIQDQLMEALQKSPNGLILDLDAVSFISSAGLRVLIVVYKSAAAAGTKLAMIRPQPEIYKLLKLASLEQTFNVFENETDAVKAISP